MPASVTKKNRRRHISPNDTLTVRLKRYPFSPCANWDEVNKACRRLAGWAVESRLLKKPRPGPLPCQFLEELQAQGVPTGPYNLPDWDDNPGSLHQCLRSLFEHTPPTALLVEDAKRVPAVMQFLAERNIKSPRDISVISLDPDESFQWIDPPISHLSFDSRPCPNH